MAFNPLKVSLENIIPLTEARDHFSQIVSEVQKDKLYVLTKGGKPAVAIIDVKYLERISGGEIQEDKIEKEIQKAPEKVGRTPMVEHKEVTPPAPKPFSAPLSHSKPEPIEPQKHEPVKPYTPPVPEPPKPITEPVSKSFSPPTPPISPPKPFGEPKTNDFSKPIEPAKPAGLESSGRQPIEPPKPVSTNTFSSSSTPVVPPPTVKPQEPPKPVTPGPVIETSFSNPDPFGTTNTLKTPPVPTKEPGNNQPKETQIPINNLSSSAPKPIAPEATIDVRNMDSSEQENKASQAAHNDPDDAAPLAQVNPNAPDPDDMVID